MTDKPSNTTSRPPHQRVAAKSARATTSRRKPGPAATARHDDKLTAILRTAAQQFASRGYEATSLDMIADQLGMHKATLYHYVNNKESILYQCLVKSFGDLDRIMDRMHDRSIPVQDRLREFVRSLAAAQNNDFGRCQVLVGSRPLDTSAGAEIQQFKRRLDHTVRDLVTEGIADGTFRPCHPGMVSAMLFGALNWVPRWYSEQGKFSIQDVADNFLDTLVNGIAGTRR
ncbi:TetR/AcrR family transcriptional regulator [Hydrogenophaga sp.]|uniref:TetR/AcrR family transcriptional regulator n=1 Tax=Hydrogenophaga sp. TaxID=1904254 RepID=UPI0026334C07|nr:TetR/AcrR family transcriptional regulator [Hydrogenophaga sp.]MCW5653377.1 TetR family transcriptional regulator [Hydrogenophaga sp.]